ncbi:MAG: hypothetical protein Q8P49_02790 [Candidatus Liptonbacteria bacterium]|nr:hypothetical protein [Candidatus Liptonbacteria bacterium]
MLTKIKRQRGLNAVFIISATIISGAMSWAYAALKNARGTLILHFNNVDGIDQIGGVGELERIGITGLVVVVLNFFIATELEARDGFLGKLLAGATLFFAALLFIGFAAIISVN